MTTTKAKRHRDALADVEKNRKVHSVTGSCTYHRSKWVQTKRRYRTKKAARGKTKKGRNTYLCDSCGWWHTASK